MAAAPAWHAGPAGGRANHEHQVAGTINTALHPAQVAGTINTALHLHPARLDTGTISNLHVPVLGIHSLAFIQQSSINCDCTSALHHWASATICLHHPPSLIPHLLSWFHIPHGCHLEASHIRTRNKVRPPSHYNHLRMSPQSCLHVTTITCTRNHNCCGWQSAILPSCHPGLRCAVPI